MKPLQSQLQYLAQVAVFSIATIQAQVQWHGRLHVDAGAYLPDTALDNAREATAGMEIRRIRLTAKGNYSSSLKYKISVDFGKGKVAIKDAYLDFKVCPNTDHARLRIGHFKEPYRWDVLNSSNQILLPGRPEVTGAFGKERNAGIMVYGYLTPKVAYQVGAFRNYQAGAHQIVTLSHNPSVINTNRIAVLPLKKSSQWIMAAGYFRHQIGQGANYVVKVGTESLFAPKLISLAIDTLRNGRWIGGELAASFGPLYFQSEYIAFSGQSVGNGNINIGGGYVQMAYILTGEHRPIKSALSGVKAIAPKQSWGKSGGWGAWEIVGRYSLGDFRATAYPKGALSTLSVGINWYPYAKARIMLNYVRPMLSGSDKYSDGTAHIIQTRFMIFF